MSKIEERLAEIGLTVPVRDWRGAKFDYCYQDGSLLYLGGHSPADPDGQLRLVGKLGKDLSLEQGKEAARNCALNHLGSAKAFLGDLDRIEGVIKVLGLVNSADDFYQQPEVMHGYTDVWLHVLGDKGRHTRSAIGVNTLPSNIAVEVECLLKIRP